MAAENALGWIGRKERGCAAARCTRSNAMESPERIALDIAQLRLMEAAR
jgi:hypothetical protein